MKKVTIIIGENRIEACQSCAESPEEEKIIQENIVELIRPELNRINDKLQAETKVPR